MKKLKEYTLLIAYLGCFIAYLGNVYKNDNYMEIVSESAIMIAISFFVLIIKDMKI